MKLKEIDRTANVAWSPAVQHPIYLAAGTAAQQLDATFSTSASLELYSLNLGEPSQEMELAASLNTESRFHKLVWGSHGIGSNSASSGLLIGGAEQGQLFVWDVAKILSEDDDESLVHKFTKHTGPVAAIDINPFQVNLVASGASDSEIFIWDLNNAEKPMTPGTKAQPPHDVSCVAWNRQVQHILSSSHGGNCVVWDLRKNEPIIKIRDSMAHMKCSAVCWHPDIATQLCMASEDDHTPVIQLWDLRSATSPLKLLESHQRGVLSMAWCPSDSDLLLSCGKDNRILCWNPNSEQRSGEVVYEFASGNQWSFDVQWCPRNPAVVSGCSFDGHISIYSLMGSALPAQTSSKVVEAFTLGSMSQPLPQHAPDTSVNQAMLKKPPKWLRRPVGASFAFGGKLVSFESVKNGQQTVSSVTISQVVTETELVARSLQLEQTLASGRYSEFCDAKIASCTDPLDATVWSFLKVNFAPDSRQQYLNLLGYSQADIRNKVSDAMRNKLKSPSSDSQHSEHLQDETSDATSAFDMIDHTGLENNGLSIHCSNDYDGLVTQALLTANFDAAVDVCVANGRWAEAIILAIAGGSELLASTEKRFFDANKSSLNQLIWAVVTQKFETIVETCDLQNWKEALAVVLTYAGGDEFTKLCDLMGRRLESEGDEQLASNAHLCYIVSGNTEQLVSSWNKILPETSSQHTLQDLIEKVMILWKGVESVQSLQNISQGHVAKRLHQYAEELASQGCVATAINYLTPVSSDDLSVAVLKDRLNRSLGLPTTPPFRTVDVTAVRPTPPATVTAAVVDRQRTTSASYTADRQRTTSANYSQNTMDSLGQQFAHSTQVADNYLQSSQPTNVASYQNRVQPSSNAPAAPTALAKGPLNKYHTQQQPATNQYMDQADPMSHLYNSNMYGLPTAAAAYTSPGAPATMPQPVYNVSQSATGAWNDPPVVKDAPRSEAPGAPRFEGKLLNPAEYQPTALQATQSHQPQALTTDQFREHIPEPVAAASYGVQQQCVAANVPVEHKILQDIFNQLLQLCAARAVHNPQIKKKLEDVSRKLDALYTRLCTGSLSPSTIAGLHQIVGAIQQFDYQTALAYHAQIVGAGSFTEISAFMLGIKMLMQTAMQL